MGMFSSIMDKIFGSADAAEPAAAAAAPATGAQGGAGRAQPSSGAAAKPAAAGAPAQPVDVEAVLTQMASQKGGGGNWRTSIVDLLKLLGLESDLEARKELAAELNVNAGAAGTAEQNIALHKAVMRKLAENGGKVPESLKN